MIINVVDVELLNNGVDRPTLLYLSFSLNLQFFYMYFCNEKSVFILFLEKVRELNESLFSIFFIHNLTAVGLALLEILAESKIRFDVFVLDGSFYWLKIYYCNFTVLLRCSYKIIPFSIQTLCKFNGLFFAFPDPSPASLSNSLPNDRLDFQVFDKNESLFGLIDAYVKVGDYSNRYYHFYLYSLRNIEVLKLSIEKIKEIINREDSSCFLNNFSTPAMAHSLFFKKFNSLKIPEKLPKKLDIYMREALYGGRCEVFGNLKNDEHVKYFDFASMYASCLLDKFHIGDGYFATPSDFTIPGFYSIDFLSGYSNLPVLPRHSKTGKLWFANGRGSGVYWFEEIVEFIQNGGKVERINSAILFKNYDYCFANFVNKFLPLRSQDKLSSAFGKYFLNSFYGSTALRPEKYTTFVTYSEDEAQELMRFLTVKKISRMSNVILLTIEVDEKFCKAYNLKKRPLSTRNVSIAAAVASKARIKLYRAFLEIEKDGGRLLYCDTDSIFAAYSTLDTRQNFGSKKWLKFYPNALFISPKTYALDGPQGCTVKMGGLSSKNVLFSEFKDLFYEGKNLKTLEYKLSLVGAGFSFEARYPYSNKRILSKDAKSSEPFRFNDL